MASELKRCFSRCLSRTKLFLSSSNCTGTVDWEAWMSASSCDNYILPCHWLITFNQVAASFLQDWTVINLSIFIVFVLSHCKHNLRLLPWRAVLVQFCTEYTINISRLNKLLIFQHADVASDQYCTAYVSAIPKLRFFLNLKLFVTKLQNTVKGNWTRSSKLFFSGRSSRSSVQEANMEDGISRRLVWVRCVSHVKSFPGLL